MKPGDLVRNCWSGYYLPLYEKPHGIMVLEFLASELGIVLNTSYSSTGIPYVQILTSDGKIGWVRCERVEVLE